MRDTVSEWDQQERVVSSAIVARSVGRRVNVLTAASRYVGELVSFTRGACRPSLWLLVDDADEFIAFGDVLDFAVI